MSRKQGHGNPGSTQADDRNNQGALVTRGQASGRPLKQFVVIIPFVDLATSSPNFFVAMLDASSWWEAQVRMCDVVAGDEDRLLNILVGPDASGGCTGPNYLEEYGLVVGDCLALEVGDIAAFEQRVALGTPPALAISANPFHPADSPKAPRPLTTLRGASGDDGGGA